MGRGQHGIAGGHWSLAIVIHEFLQLFRSQIASSFEVRHFFLDYKKEKKKCIFDMVRPTTLRHDIVVNAPIADLVLVKATVTDELLLLVVVEAVRTRLLPASALTKAPMRLLLPPEAVGVAGSFHTTDWTGIPYVFICCSYS